MRDGRADDRPAAATARAAPVARAGARRVVRARRFGRDRHRLHHSPGADAGQRAAEPVLRRGLRGGGGGGLQLPGRRAAAHAQARRPGAPGVPAPPARPAVSLAGLLEPHATVTVAGLAKNAGKTTVMNHLLATLEGPFGLASLGLDGEARDQLTGLAKPRVRPPAGALVATADGLA